jgi:hypothetical protein
MIVACGMKGSKTGEEVEAHLLEEEIRCQRSVGGYFEVVAVEGERRWRTDGREKEGAVVRRVCNERRAQREGDKGKGKIGSGLSDGACRVDWTLRRAVCRRHLFLQRRPRRRQLQPWPLIRPIRSQD